MPRPASAISVPYLLLGIWLSVLCASSVTADQLKLNWSSYQFSGDYGRDSERKTNTEVNQLTLQYRQRQWQLEVSQAYLQQSGPRQVLVDEYVDEDGYNVQQFEEQHQQRRGFGDPSVKLSYLWPAAGSALRRREAHWRFSGRLKLPLMDEDEGFSNGRREGFVSLQRSQRFTHAMISVSVGRHWRSARQQAPNNTRNYLKAAAMVFPRRDLGLGASLYIKQASSGQTQIARSLSLNGLWRINGRWQLNGLYGIGLSDVVSDDVLGLTLSYRWRL